MEEIFAVAPASVKQATIRSISAEDSSGPSSAKSMARSDSR
jgi:hypothetical protein